MVGACVYAHSLFDIALNAWPNSTQKPRGSFQSPLHQKLCTAGENSFLQEEWALLRCGPREESMQTPLLTPYFPWAFNETPSLRAPLSSMEILDFEELNALASLVQGLTHLHLCPTFRAGDISLPFNHESLYCEEAGWLFANNGIARTAIVEKCAETFTIWWPFSPNVTSVHILHLNISASVNSSANIVYRCMWSGVALAQRRDPARAEHI